MCEIDLQGIKMSDEEPRVFQQFPDRKGKQPQDNEGLT